MACNCLSRAWHLCISSQRLTGFLARPTFRNYATAKFAKSSWMEFSANNGIRLLNRPLWRKDFNVMGSVGKRRLLIQSKGLHGKANSGHSRAKFNMSERHKSVAMYTVSVVILVCGGSYAAVPLYRLYCQASGYGGTVKVIEVGEKIENMEKQNHRLLTVKFNADKSATMQWDFKPQQSQIKIVPGETALAFYTAKNPTDVPITGVSTYNVIPFEAGQYFNKIQCFCFEEQRLNPGEEVDMPVFFYIDPEFVLDPSLRKVTEITLSYTFFEAKDGSWPDLGVQPSYAVGGHGTT